MHAAAGVVFGRKFHVICKEPLTISQSVYDILTTLGIIWVVARFCLRGFGF